MTPNGRPPTRPGGHRERRQVEQVREVRVPAHPAVGADRVGRDLGERRMPGGGRGEQRRRSRRAPPGQRAEPIEPLAVPEVVDRGGGAAAEHDRGDGRVERRSGCAAMTRPTAALRSATNAPPYSSAAASSSGAMSTSTISTPVAASRATTAANASAQPSASSPRCSAVGTRDARGAAGAASRGRGRAGPGRRGPPAARAAWREPSRAKTVTQSSVRHGGHHARRRDQAARRLHADDAVQGGRAPGRSPRCRCPGRGRRSRARPRRPTRSSSRRRSACGSHALRTAPNGLRVPTRPVANWSRLVLPSTIAPAAAQPGDRRRVGLGVVGVGRAAGRGRAARRRRCCP